MSCRWPTGRPRMRQPGWAPGARPGAGGRGAGGEPRASPAVQPPVSPPLARLSYSAIEQYARCGYRFYLERVARLRDGSAAAPGVELLPVAGDAEVGVEPVRGVWDAAVPEAGEEGQLGLPLAAAATSA